MVEAVFDVLLSADRQLTRTTTELRWGPATEAFVVLSAWWVKGLVFVAAGLVRDLRQRPPVPVCALAVAVSFGLASAMASAIKNLVERLRPPLGMPDLSAVVPLPGTFSFPSGHASTAFAAAAALAVFVPRLRVAALVLAALIAISRVYLGVHFWLDVLAGAALGAATGVALAIIARDVIGRRVRRSDRTAGAARPGAAGAAPAPGAR